MMAQTTDGKTPTGSSIPSDAHFQSNLSSISDGWPINSEKYSIIINSIDDNLEKYEEGAIFMHGFGSADNDGLR